MDVSSATYFATLLPGVIAVLAPGLASFLSREHFPSEVTAGLTVAVTAAGAFLTEFIQGGSYSWSSATLKAFAAYIIAAEARSQFWAKTGTNARLLAYPRKLPRRGETVSHFGGLPDDAPTPEPPHHPMPGGSSTAAGRHQAPETDGK